MTSFQPGSVNDSKTLLPQLLPSNKSNVAADVNDDNIEKNFDHFYSIYRSRVYGVALRYLKSPADACEVVQEVFMKLWTERDKIKSGTPIEAWLYTVAKNNTINRLKRIAIEWKAINYIKDNQHGSSVSAANKVEEADCNRMLHNALSSLSENQYKVYKLAREENYSYIEIAEHLSISPLTVKTHMARALARLKQLLPVINNA